MRRTRVFIWGSCVSRDTFEHFIPEEFELLQYVARQSALSAYTRPVSMLEPPTFASQFQQRQVSGDFTSSLRADLTKNAQDVDMLLIDLVDERLGVHLLPDGTVITRSVELIQSGIEERLPEGTQHLPFGSPTHFRYWTDAIAALDRVIRETMPRAAIVLLDLPWAERSLDGTQTPASFGVDAAHANAVARPYVDVAVQTLGAHTIRLDPSEVTSSDQHPWGESPFHYSENVYLDVVHRLTGADGRTVWNRTSNTGNNAPEPPQHSGNSKHKGPREGLDVDHGELASSGPNFLIAGTERGGTRWLHRRLSAHPSIFIPKQPGNYFNHASRMADSVATSAYLSQYEEGANAPLRGDRTADYFWTTGRSPFSPIRNHDTAAAIRDSLDPHAHVLLSLRNPVGRAVSAYWNLFSQAKISPDIGLFQVDRTHGLIDRGFYRRHYLHWVKSLGESRITVLLYDDLVNRPDAYLLSALAALDLPGDLRYWENEDFHQRIGNTPWVNRFRRQSKITGQEIAALLELYMDDILFVEEIVERKLPNWRNLDLLIKRNTAGRA